MGKYENYRTRLAGRQGKYTMWARNETQENLVLVLSSVPMSNKAGGGSFDQQQLQQQQRSVYFIDAEKKEVDVCVIAPWPRLHDAAMYASLFKRSIEHPDRVVGIYYIDRPFTFKEVIQANRGRDQSIKPRFPESHPPFYIIDHRHLTEMSSFCPCEEFPVTVLTGQATGGLIAGTGSATLVRSPSLTAGTQQMQTMQQQPVAFGSSGGSGGGSPTGLHMPQVSSHQ